LEQTRAAQSVNRVDRWRYRSAVHAAKVLNSMGGSQPAGGVSVDARRPGERQLRGVEVPRPRSS
jgi:hypothetical protein